VGRVVVHKLLTHHNLDAQMHTMMLLYDADLLWFVSAIKKEQRANTNLQYATYAHVEQDQRGDGYSYPPVWVGCM